MAILKKSFSLCTLGLVAALASACSSTSDDASGGTTTGGQQGQGGAGSGIVEARSEKAFDTAPAPAAADYAALVAGSNDFGFELYKKLEADDNRIYSPASITAALSMTYAGARGETAKQMAAVLHDTLGQDGWAAAYNKLVVDLAARNVPLHATNYGDMSLTLKLADAVFAQKDYAIEAAFLDTLSVHYDAGVKVLDFAADPEASRVLINGWVEDHTEKKIKDLLAPGTISDQTRLVLANALYFYGSWARPFDPKQTADATFHAPGGDVTVKMMRQTESLPYYEGDGFKATELGYDGGKVAMTIVLPDEGKLGDVEGKLSSAWLTATAAELGKASAEVAIGLPKFKFTWGSKELGDALKALGMTDAFSLPPADFSGIEPKKELYISHVIHKAFVGVDEYGTEAAAATAVVMDVGSAPGDPKAFELDRPFLFVLRDTGSGAVLFVGKVADPTK
jgi:serpin B